MSDDIKAILYLIILCLVLFSVSVIMFIIDCKTPIIEPQKFIGDRVVKIERTAFNNEYIITSRDGKIVKTRDFKKYEWIQK